MRTTLLLIAAIAVAACSTQRNAEPAGAGRRETATTDVPRPPAEDSCENFSLSYGPVALPSATVGVAYSVRVADYADPDWWGSTFLGDVAAPGIAIEGRSSRETLALRGTPTAAGAFDFTIEAARDPTSDGCSFMPDPHRFHLEVTDGSDAGTDAGH